MREFVSHHDYRHFAASVTFQSRYVFEPKVDDFIRTVIETAQSRIETLDAGSVLHRAQVGHDWDSQPLDTDDPAGDSIDVPAGLPAERMKPLKASAREGRVNPKGIPCLYLADEADTAMAETRPWLGSHISLARFVILKPIKIVLLPEPKLHIRFSLGTAVRTPTPAERDDAVW